jgi:hypothetical protein
MIGDMYRVLTRLRFIEPQLPTLVEAPPEGKRTALWLAHVKEYAFRMA